MSTVESIDIDSLPMDGHTSDSELDKKTLNNNNLEKVTTVFQDSSSTKIYNISDDDDDDVDLVEKFPAIKKTQDKYIFSYNNSSQVSKIVENEVMDCDSTNKPTDHLKKTCHNVCINISSSSDEEIDLPPMKKLISYGPHSASTFENNEAIRPSSHSAHSLSTSEDELPELNSVPELPKLDSLYPVKTNIYDDDSLKMLNDDERDKSNTKITNKWEVKKLEKERAKALREIEKEIKNNAKPKMALKLIHMKVDNKLKDFADSDDLWAIFQNAEINYSLEDNIIESSILWWREVIDCRISDDGKINRITKEVPEDQLLIMYSTMKFVDMIEDWKWPSKNFNNDQKGSNVTTNEAIDFHNDTNLLLASTSSHKNIFPDKKITYAVIGMEKYFREQKNHKARNYKSMVRGTQSNAIGQRTSSLSFSDVEEAIVCLQVHEEVNIHLVETMSDLGSLVVSLNKAIAEAPFKRENKQNAFSWYADGDTVKGVKVNNDGIGLLQLWEQQIQQFPLVSKDVSEAIVSNYSSPQLLLEAYEKCNTTQEAENLLKDIVVRRGIGPLATSRHIGPELSHKIYRFLMEDDETVKI